MQYLNEPIHLGAGVVKIKTGARRGRHTELVVQRLRAVVTHADGHALLVCQRGQIQRVHVREYKTHQSGAFLYRAENPDAAELIRGKSGRVYGNLVSLLTMMKSLPMAYNKDLQEDKEPLFDTVDTVQQSLTVFNSMIASAKFKKIPLSRLQSDGFLTATDMADYLVLKGLPFRDAHEITGKTVAFCIKRGKTLEALTLQELKKFSTRFSFDVFDHISIENSVKRKNVYGGTAGKQVLRQITRLGKLFRKRKP